MSTLIKSSRFLLAALVLFFATGLTVRAQGYNDTYGGDQASYQQFYDELSPYGQWVNDPQYGYVWVPDAGNDFRPYYSNGYWVPSDYGNTWVSNYPWGWAPFHYGRWTYSDYYGWLWVPGNEWGPAWVSWRSGGGSYGWAPLGPGVSVGVGLSNSYYVPDYWWTFTPQQYILSPSFHNYCYGPSYNPRYLHQTTIINNSYAYNHHTYITGPRRQELEQVIGRPVRPVAIVNSPRPDRTQLHGNSLNIYRPTIADRGPQATERPRTFSPSSRPITNGANSPRVSGFDHGAGSPAMGRDRNPVIQQQQAPVQQQPVRNNWGNRPPDQRQERPRLDPVMQIPQQQQQPPRRVEQPQQVVQPDQRPRGWSRPQQQQAPQQVQPQRQDRPVYTRPAPMPRQQEVQRPQPPQREERPQPAIQQQPVQRVEQPRMEAPRQEAPSERPGSGGDSRFNRR